MSLHLRDLGDPLVSLCQQGKERGKVTPALGENLLEDRLTLLGYRGCLPRGSAKSSNVGADLG
jgi:hypothetical protein